MLFKSLLSIALSAATASAQMANLTTLLTSTPELSNLTSLISGYPSLLTALESAQNITLLAPNNAALSAFLNSSAGASAVATPGLVEAVLMYHVIEGSFYSTDIKSTPSFLSSLLTNTSYTNVTSGQVVEAVKVGNQTMLYSALKMNSTVVQADLNFTGGTVHIIDSVLSLPGNDSTTAEAANLTALAGAVETLMLDSTLESLQNVTIFAPNNAAFQAIGSAIGTLSTAQLTQILEYHVIEGTIGYSSDLKNETIKSLGGGNITITIEDGNVFVNSAKVIVPDVLVSNGVLHVIDSVLNPNNTMVSPNVTATSTTAVAYSGASSASSVPFTSGVPTPSSSIGAVGTATTGVAASSGSGSATGGSTSSSSSAGAAPMKTAAVGAAALFGGVALLVDW